MYMSDNVTPAIRARIAIERRIVKLTVKTLIEAGYALSVFDGEEQTAYTTTDFKMLHDALMETDEDYLYAKKADADGKMKKSFVYFVYGNDGWDVISDHSVSLEDVLKPVFELAERLEVAA